MKKIFVFIILLNLINNASWAIGNPVSVNNFYLGLKTLENASSLDVANEAQQRMSACFMASEQSGINLYMDGLEYMSSSLYTMKLFMMIFKEKSLKTNYNINQTEIVEQPDQTGSMQKKGAQHYVTYVTKQYIKDGKTTTYNDVVFTLISNGLIVEMENSESSGSVQPKPSPTEELNTEQLRAKAAYYYSKNRYIEAYNCYEKLVARAPEDGDASYRIALLTFWRKGCKNRFNKRTARDKAMSYINRAIEYGNYEIKTKATNVKANWENGNVYF